MRCDEGKPVCKACTRLGLNCSFEPDCAASATAGRSRYRVRFVSSQYTKLSQGEDESVKTKTPLPEQSQRHSASGGESCPGLLDANVENIAIQGGTESLPNRGIRNEQAVMSSVAGSPHQNPSVSVMQEQATIDLNPQHLNPDEAQMNSAHMPAFFGLDMNFDLLNEDWFPYPDAGSEGTTVESTARPGDACESEPEDGSVTIDQDDHGLIQHYLNVMTGYAKIRYSGDENLYSQIFSNMALFYAPLYNALMAWAALHLGQIRSDADLIQKAKERYTLAVSLMHRDQDVAHHFELSLVTIWFSLQYELLAASGIDSFCQHLEFTADLVDAHRRHQKAGGQAATLGHIGCRVLVWLGAYDSRASLIGGTGRLLQNLELFSSENDFLDAAFPDQTPNTGGLQDIKPCLRMNLDFDIAEGRIVQLYRREVAAPAVTWSTMQSNLLSIRDRLEGDKTIASIITSLCSPTFSQSGRITTKRFNCLLLLATFYSVVISFHRMMPVFVANSMPIKVISGEMAATRIIRIASFVCRTRPASPQNIWPRILFLAGIETTDLVYQDWVIKTLADAEIWGANFGKTRVLLENVIRAQSREGVRVDYLDIMKQSTGLFII